MPMCEKCWRDAAAMVSGGDFVSQASAYEYLLEQRRDNPCTPEEQRTADDAADYSVPCPWEITPGGYRPPKA